MVTSNNNVIVGKTAIDFTTNAILADNQIDPKFNLKQYLKGSKGILFFYPLNFTFVCPSEILAFHNRLGEFTTRNTKVIGISVDSHFCHLAWKNNSYKKGGIGNICFILASDLNRKISQSYHVLNEDGVSLRGTFIIDEDFIIRHMSINDMFLGRNVDEFIRLIDAMNHYKEYGEVCPASWEKGKVGIQETQQGIADFLISNADKL